MNNNYTEIMGVNTLDTNCFPDIRVQLLNDGYLVQTNTLNISKNLPVLLGC